MINSTIDSLTKSWKTTIAGLLAGAVILFPQLETAFNAWALGGSWDDFNFEMVLIAIGLIVGGVVARDNSVTSKNAGAE